MAGLLQLLLLCHSGFPKMIKTREKLAEYLTVIIFTTSAQHAAVNFGQVGISGKTVLLSGLGDASTGARSEKCLIVDEQLYIVLPGQNNCRATAYPCEGCARTNEGNNCFGGFCNYSEKDILNLT